MFYGREGIQQPYQQDDIADHYIHSRYEKEPFGRAVHDRQVRIVKKVVIPHQVSRLLEIAPGPARLTIYASAREFACAIDQSAAMLRVAKARLTEFEHHDWKLVRGDAFCLPLRTREVDFVMCFKLIRHFAAADRRALLAEIHRILRPHGYLFLDVVNAPANHWLHTKWGVTDSWIDDYWFEKTAFEAEMQEAGFCVHALYAVHPALRLQYYIWTYLYPRASFVARVASRGLETLTAREPLEWMALCKCV
jgi:ubiquinone/menaquinone biosynthesis C-methylase UbiE